MSRNEFDGLFRGRDDSWFDRLKLEIVKRRGFSLPEEAQELELISFAEVMAEVEEEEKNGIQYGLLTGFPTFDKAFEGLNKGELYVVGAATGVGKSLFVQNIALKVAQQNKTVLFITTEMTPKENTKRMRKMLESNAAMPPIVYNSPKKSVTTASLRTTIEKHKDYNFDLVIIDNLQYFIRSAENEAEEIGLATKECKEISRIFEVPVILVSGIRKIYNTEKEPEMDDLRGSSFISQDADGVISLWRSKEKGAENTLIATIKKNRRTGEVGYFSMTTKKGELLLREGFENIERVEKLLKDADF